MASTGGDALVSGAIVIGRWVSAAEGAGAAATGGAACTFCRAHPATASENPQAMSAATTRAFELRLGIYLSFLFCKRLAEVADLSGRRLDGAR